MKMKMQHEDENEGVLMRTVRDARCVAGKEGGRAEGMLSNGTVP